MSGARNTNRVNLLHWLAALTMFASMTPAASHGRLMDPPARNSMWRLGFSNPVNYNDNELYCGGRGTQWARNKGKCGVCGDPYHNAIKDHEVGGKYANGIISREYTQGGTIEIVVHITANHKGYFEFRICPVEDPKVEVTQECLDTHVMTLANGEGSRYFLPEGKSNQFFNVSVQLPEDVACKQCVVQWKYRTGNTWDKDENGKFCVGCGPQEEFFNCADVTVHPRGSSAEAQQNGNSKPLIQNGGGESNRNADPVQKKEDTHFSGKKDDLKTAAGDKISEYGRQKVRFLQKLENNKYSLWEEPKKTNGEYSYGSPFAHLARKGNEGSRKEKSNLEKLGDIDDSYLNQYPVARSQDQVSGYQWKAGVSNSTEVDRIRRRFGYSISSTRDNHSKNISVAIQGKTTEKVNVIGKTTEKVNVIGKTTEKVNVIGKTTEKVNVIRKNGMTTRIDSSKDNHTYPRMTIQHESRSALIPRTSRREGVTTIPLEDTKLMRDNLIDSHNSPVNLIKDVNRNQKVGDGFLQKWKLQKLRRIAALRALQSMYTTHKNTARFWYTSQRSHEVTRPMMRTTRVQTRNSTTPVIRFTRPPQESHDFVKQRIGSNIYSSAAGDHTKPPKRQLGNQHSNLRTQLPAWLATALKFKESETRDDFKSGRRDSKMNFNKEIRKLAVKENRNKELKESFSRPELPYVPHEHVNVSLHKRISHTNQKTKMGQMSVHKIPADLSDVPRNYDREDVDKHRKDDLSEPSYKDIQNGDNTGTESLVRYIVSLLISQMKNYDSNEYTGKLSTRNKPMFGDILLSTMTPFNTKENATTSKGYSWFAPADLSTTTTKDIRVSSATKDYKKKNTNTGTIFKTDLGHDSQRKQENLPPTVRGEVNAFNGLILGSDFGNNQGLNRNQVEKYHNWRTVGQSGKHEDVNTQGIKPQTILSNIKNNIADNGNNLYQNKYKRRQDYADLVNDQQQREWLLNSQVQVPQEIPIDRHQLWSLRAERRRNHYNRQQEVARSELVCESLVVLSGGMDRWCTDNCNANFCPSSLCVCTVREAASSSQVVTVPLAISRKYTLVHPRQHNGAVSRHHNEAQTRQYNRAVENEAAFQGFFTPLDMNPRSDRYMTSTRTAITKSPEYQTGNSERSYRFPIITQTPVPKNLQSFKDKTNTDKIGLLLANILEQANSLIQPRDNNINSFKSSKSVSNYLLNSGRTQERKKTPFTFDSLQQKDTKNQLNNPHLKEDHHKLPQTAHNNINTRFQTMHQIPELSQRSNWYTNTNGYNLRSNNNPELNQENRARGVFQPYRSHSDATNQGALPNSAFSNSGLYNLKDTHTPIFYSRRPIYSQLPAVRPSVGIREGQSRLICKAIGAFAGVTHFDEWCLSTCLTTMCPLTVCSCEQRASHQPLSGR